MLNLKKSKLIVLMGICLTLGIVLVIGILLYRDKVDFLRYEEQDIHTHDEGIEKAGQQLPARLTDSQSVEKAYQLATDTELSEETRLKAARALETTGVQHYDRSIALLGQLISDPTITDKQSFENVIKSIRDMQRQFNRSQAERIGDHHRIAKKRANELIAELSQKETLNDEERAVLELSISMQTRLKKMEEVLLKKIRKLENELNQLTAKKSPTDRDLINIKIAEQQVSDLKTMLNE